jgi:hypothetical protein
VMILPMTGPTGLPALEGLGLLPSLLQHEQTDPE